MRDINLGLRFLLELSGIAALAAWGWGAAGPPLQYGLALGAPAVLILVWALGVAPRARNRIPQGARVVLGSVLLLGTAGMLAVAGQPAMAVAFAILIVVNTMLLIVLGHPGGS